MAKNCSMSPLLCVKCAYQSKADPVVYMCKLCRVTEKKAEEHKENEEEILERPKIQLVYSASMGQRRQEVHKIASNSLT